MSTISSTGTSDASLVNWQAKMKQFRTDFGDLNSALQSGNLSAAQTAFSALQQDAPSSKNPQIKADMDALGKALNSGDLNAATTAFSKLEQDKQALKMSGHHHHKQAAQSDTDSGSDNTGTTSDNTTAGNGISSLA